MPLTRLNDSAFDAQLEGVYFGMWNGSTSVRCFVSHEALTDKAQGSGQAESLDVFHEHRSEIENLASAKYDAGSICLRHFTEFGNNAWPINNGRCCNVCNDNVVIPARIRMQRRKRN